MNLEFENDVSIILKLELEITRAIINGHKASENDQFREYRIRLKELRDKWDIKRKNF